MGDSLIMVLRRSKAEIVLFDEILNNGFFILFLNRCTYPKPDKGMGDCVLDDQNNEKNKKNGQDRECIIFISGFY